MILYAIHVVIFVGIAITEKMVSLFRVKKINLILMMASVIVMTLSVVYMSLNLLN